MKICSKCKITKGHDQFNLDKSKKDGMCSSCKACQRAYYIQWLSKPQNQQNQKLHRQNYYHERNARPEIRQRAKNNNLRRRYGLSQEDYNNLLLKQDGKCKLCGECLGNGGLKPVVDHHPYTGKVRGILHLKCNAALAHVENDTFRQQALTYLQSVEIL